MNAFQSLKAKQRHLIEEIETNMANLTGLRKNECHKDWRERCMVEAPDAYMRHCKLNDEVGRLDSKIDKASNMCQFSTSGYTKEQIKRLTFMKAFEDLRGLRTSLSKEEESNRKHIEAETVSSFYLTDCFSCV